VAFLRDIDDRVEAEREVHVVLDNLSAHKAPVIRKNSRGHRVKAVLVVETTQNRPHRHPTCWRQLMP
jgi:hypothetical protein